MVLLHIKRSSLWCAIQEKVFIWVQCTYLLVLGREHLHLVGKDSQHSPENITNKIVQHCQIYHNQMIGISMYTQNDRYFYVHPEWLIFSMYTQNDWYFLCTHRMIDIFYVHPEWLIFSMYTQNDWYFLCTPRTIGVSMYTHNDRYFLCFRCTFP